ncbi:MAG: ATP-binding protein [Bacillus sp. (in: firmicutes)]
MIRKNILLYTLIVIVPTCIASLIYKNVIDDRTQEQIQKTAENYGYVHQEYLETLVSEASKSLEVLSISHTSLSNDLDTNELLQEIKRTDKRYGDIHILDHQGNIQASSSISNNLARIPKEHVEACSTFNKPHISERIENNGSKGAYFYICKPTMKEDRQINSIVYMELRLDYIKNVLETLTPELSMKLTGLTGPEILLLNSDSSEITYDTHVMFSSVPWILHIDSSSLEPHKSNLISKFVFLSLFLTNIIFLAFQYIKLKKENIRQKKEYDNQKLAMIGTLAATTAHEIKNPLTGIKGLVQLLNEKYTDSKDQMYFSIIQKEITRIDDIVNEFLILGKPSASPLETVDIRSALNELTPILQTEAASRLVKLHLYPGNGPVNIHCIKDHIKQVILNIVKNSFEASSPGGDISICLNADDRNAIITIKDNGAGMPASTLNKIFDPFYTTKNYGTGLGLFICKRIITMYQGQIDIQSKKNKGTTIIIRFPLQH